MENLAPILNSNDIPTKAYVDAKAASSGFNAYSGRWAPAWPTPKAQVSLVISPRMIYAYRAVTQVAIQSVAVEVAGALAGGSARILTYSDANPWPGTQLAAQVVTTDAVGIKTVTMSIAKGSFWLAIHNLSSSAITLRGVTEPDPYSPGSIDATAIYAMASGIAYDTGGTTSPPTWPAGSGVDVLGASLLLRAT